MRICSLLPSATETVASLGLVESLVAVSEQCDWPPEVRARAGGREGLGRAAAPSYPTSWETVREQRPELVVVAPCGFDHVRAAREAILPQLGCRAFAVDSNAYYARPAPRVAYGVAQLAFLIHPELVADPGLPYVECVAQLVPPVATFVADQA